MSVAVGVFVALSVNAPPKLRVHRQRSHYPAVARIAHEFRQHHNKKTLRTMGGVPPWQTPRAPRRRGRRKPRLVRAKAVPPTLRHAVRGWRPATALSFMRRILIGRWAPAAAVTSDQVEFTATGSVSFVEMASRVENTAVPAVWGTWRDPQYESHRLMGS